MRHWFPRVCLLASFGLFGCFGLARAEDFAASIVRVRAVSADGVTEFGSGVLIAPARVVTACHVTRHASTIGIMHGTERWVVENQVGSLIHDLCVLVVPSATVPVATMRHSSELQPGERVIAAGFQGGGADLVVSRGTVAGLYRYDDGQVIRTTAPFDLGSSGGGLFDDAGNLVGVLAFKGRTGENLRFALPTEWISSINSATGMSSRIEATSGPRAFWELPQGDRPAFLSVAIRDASGRHD